MLQRLSTTPTTDLVDPWKAVTAPLTLPMAQRQASTNRTGPHIRTFIGLRAAYWSMRGIVRCPTYGERQTLEKSRTAWPTRRHGSWGWSERSQRARAGKGDCIRPSGLREVMRLSAVYSTCWISLGPLQCDW